MPTIQSTLDELIKSINLPNGDLPLVLPPTHLTQAKNLKSILDRSALKPFKSESYGGKEVLFLFYGGIFYQFSNKDSETDPYLAPIAFIFKPSILTGAHRYFPFDTGLLQKHRTEISLKIESFEIDPNGDLYVPSKIVYQIFGTNDNYVNPPIPFSHADPPPLCKELYELYETSRKKFKADWRVSTIECQFDKEISLEHLAWIGFPDVLEKETMEFRKKYVKEYGPNLPIFDHYPVKNTFYPNSLALKLEELALDKIFKNYFI